MLWHLICSRWFYLFILLGFSSWTRFLRRETVYNDRGWQLNNITLVIPRIFSDCNFGVIKLNFNSYVLFWLFIICMGLFLVRNELYMLNSLIKFKDYKLTKMRKLEGWGPLSQSVWLLFCLTEYQRNERIHIF